jgi:hypothetical protein
LDETKLELLIIPLYHVRKPGRNPRRSNGIPSTAKYRRKVNIWGGISFRGPTEFAVNKKDIKNTPLFALKIEIL